MAEPQQTRPHALLDLAWRTAFRIAFPIARAWWHVSRRHHEGALVAVHVGADVLLVRSSYRAEWNFPGGGVRAGESPDAAAKRELAEEIGLVAPDLQLARVICGVWDGRPDRVHMFELSLDRLPELQLDHREIVDARLIAPGEWPGMPLTGPVDSYLRDRAGMPSSQST